MQALAIGSLAVFAQSFCDAFGRRHQAPASAKFDNLRSFTGLDGSIPPAGTILIAEHPRRKRFDRTAAIGLSSSSTSRKTM